MVTSYVKGRAVEYRCKDKLYNLGYKIVIRSARSLGPFDLIAINPEKKEIALIQVKKGKASWRDIERLQQLKNIEGQYNVKIYLYHKPHLQYIFEEI